MSKSKGRLEGYVREFGKDFSTDGRNIYCKACGINISCELKSSVRQHTLTSKHRINAEKAHRQQQLLNEASAGTEDFSYDVCSAFLSADIPLYKLKHPKVRHILESPYRCRSLPDESTLRKVKVKQCYTAVMESIRAAIGESHIWCSVDESTDSMGRYVANCMVGALQERPSDCYLLNAEEIPATNHQTITKFLVDSLNLLWPEGLQNDRVLLFISDAAPYMVKSGKALSALFPRMTHVTCLAHALHRVSETVRHSYPIVDKLIASVKQVFVKSNKRLQLLKELAPDLPAPPQPVLTRWGSWISAAIYYARHQEEVKVVLTALNPNDAVAIKQAQEAIANPNIRADLAYINAHFGRIPEAIEHLEARNLTLQQSLGIINDVQEGLSAVSTGVALVAKQKLEALLAKNTGLVAIREVAEALGGEQGNPDAKIPLTTAVFFKHAPLTSCDVERSFSMYKNVLTDRRHSFKFEHLKWTLISKCNHKLL